jgi:hypothetical protein
MHVSISIQSWSCNHRGNVRGKLLFLTPEQRFGQITTLPESQFAENSVGLDQFVL